jgi:hypothetical protein
MFETTFQDLKHAVRRLGKSQGFSAAVILTLALGIGATTAIFSVVYGVLLRPLQYPEADRLVAIWEVNRRGTYSRLADPNFADFRDQNHSFQAMAKYAGTVASVAGLAESTRTRVALVTRDFFDVMGVHPVMGRVFAADDTHPGAAPALLASHRYWREQLASARALSRWKLRIQDKIYSVVGVLPEEFDFPAKTDLWLPCEFDPDNPSRTISSVRTRQPSRRGISISSIGIAVFDIAIKDNYRTCLIILYSRSRKGRSPSVPACVAGIVPDPRDSSPRSARPRDRRDDRPRDHGSRSASDLSRGLQIHRRGSGTTSAVQAPARRSPHASQRAAGAASSRAASQSGRRRRQTVPSPEWPAAR